jgi:proteasome lid subunit RPN8/RPN11
LLPEIEAHASSTDGEVCGFIYENRYIPIPNISDRHDRYYADPHVLARVLSQYGEPDIIFHTHPNGNLELSSEDQRLWYYVNSTIMVASRSEGHLRWKMYGKRRH